MKCIIIDNKVKEEDIVKLRKSYRLFFDLDETLTVENPNFIYAPECDDVQPTDEGLDREPSRFLGMISNHDYILTARTNQWATPIRKWCFDHIKHAPVIFTRNSEYYPWEKHLEFKVMILNGYENSLYLDTSKKTIMKIKGMMNETNR